MIGDPHDTKPIRRRDAAKIAVRDAVVTGVYVLVANLAALGYPPTLPGVYSALLAAILMGLTSYMRAEKITVPPQ